MTPKLEVPDCHFVVFEGADGVGKTRLATGFAAASKWPLVHNPFTPNIDSLFSKYHSTLATCSSVVFDRSFVSELVYGPVVRGVSRLTPTESRTLVALVAQRGGTLIHVVASAEQIHERLLLRDGEAPTLREIGNLLSGYEHVFKEISHSMPVVRWNTSMEDER